MQGGHVETRFFNAKWAEPFYIIYFLFSNINKEKEQHKSNDRS